MVRLKDVVVLKDLSLSEEKIAGFKLKKLAIVGLVGLFAYSIAKSGHIANLIFAVMLVLATVVIAMVPDRSISFENKLQAMLYYYALKTKPQNMTKKESTAKVKAVKKHG